MSINWAGMSHYLKRSSLSGRNGCMVWKKWVQFLYLGVFMMEVGKKLFPVRCIDLSDASLKRTVLSFIWYMKHLGVSLYCIGTMDLL